VNALGCGSAKVCAEALGGRAHAGAAPSARLKATAPTRSQCRGRARLVSSPVGLAFQLLEIWLD
jgi:hypothetical protein